MKGLECIRKDERRKKERKKERNIALSGIQGINTSERGLEVSMTSKMSENELKDKGKT